MSTQGSKHDPYILDSDDEGSESGGYEYDLAVDEAEEPKVITIDDNDELEPSVPTPSKNSYWRVPSPKPFKRAPPIELPSVKEGSLEYDFTIEVGDAVELRDSAVRSSDVLHSGDFLYVTAIWRNLETDEVKLRGYRMRRTKYHGQVFDWKLNELVMLLETSEDDPRPAFEQGQVDIPVTDIVKKRMCVLTNKAYPFQSFRLTQSWADLKGMTKEEAKKKIFYEGQLVCRWVHICIVNENGKTYSGEARGLYSRECVGEPHAPGPSRVSISRENSITIDDDDDLIIVSKREAVRAGKKRQRSDSNAKTGGTPSKRRAPAHQKKKKKYTLGDVFCGAGGASEGARQAGLLVKWGLDHDENAIVAYGANFATANIYQLDAHNFPPPDAPKESLKVDILHLSPPCKYWSPAHTRPGQNDQANYEAIFTVGAILSELKPRIATLEQTFGLATSREHQRNFRQLKNDIIKAGYDLRYTIEDMSAFGLPQQRKRLLIIAARRGTPLPPFPKPTHGPRGSGLKRFVSVFDALEPLRRLAARNHHDTYHQPLLRRPINKEPYNPHTSFLKGCVTVSGGENHHYSGKRRYTARELSLLQSFPYGYHFTGTHGEAVKQIGNAYPPVMAAAVFKMIIRILEALDEGWIGPEDDLTRLTELFQDMQIGSPGSASRPSSRRTPYFPSTPMKKSIWSKITDIEPSAPKYKRQTCPSLSSLWDGVGSKGSLVSYTSRKSSEQLTDAEKLELAEACGEVIELD
ncbi:S-adenosyl-L-methionine-dependent methyltransferase [Lojkania enalia]|uniref:DNA (cytosine-5-)-methyltransferase n=1 Tax=Lojkania enalia TaxID=147567 RepID=A0A9P4MYP6_9PLEO|nr:S-adenosyl-L-methionine-dependent methyltransferase [Didymosphaeria enalia]